MFAIIATAVIYFIIKYILDKEYQEFEPKVMRELGLSSWDIDSHYDVSLIVKSQLAMEKYDILDFFKEHKEKLAEAERIINRKYDVAQKLKNFLADNKYKTNILYPRLKKQFYAALSNEVAYRIHIESVSATGKILGEKTVNINQARLENIVYKIEYPKLEAEVFKALGFFNWNIVPYIDDRITVKSRQALENYDYIRYFRENKEKLSEAEEGIKRKILISQKLNCFLKTNAYKSNSQYHVIEQHVNTLLNNTAAYRIHVTYISPAGNHLGEKTVNVDQYNISVLYQDPSLLLGKGEYSKLLKEQQREALNQKHHEYYDQVNKIIDYANENREFLIIKDSQAQLDKLIAQLFDRTVNSIKKIKNLDSEEWDMVGSFMSHLNNEIHTMVRKNQMILEYYVSPHFSQVKESCDVLMNTQREFNQYIIEKVESISNLFGVRVIRNETVNDDEYNYIRPYKKTISPFTAEVSAAVFASAENNPLGYIVKNFYPNKDMYPAQIQKLYLFVEELETLRDAKQIIENYKLEYQQYLGDVPSFVLENDEAGFYSRLGFANIDESVFTVEYKFSYTSNGGMAQRSFTVPMTVDTIAELIEILKSKLTASAFVKEQRTLMTKKLRESIKKRDNYTCCHCGNSVYLEPNLLLEIDHKIPISRGGCTEESNLQTLCWKCNRSKSDKIVS